MIKYGIKLWSSNESHVIDEVKEHIDDGVIDFLELYITPNSLAAFDFSLLNDIPTTIHNAHEKHGFNLMKRQNTNFSLLKEAQNFADRLNSDVIVVHPGIGGRVENLMSNLLKLTDSRIYIENMPKFAGEEFRYRECYGYSYEQLTSIINRYNFCFDFSHAIKASISMNKSYTLVINDMLKLNPHYIHICDGLLSNPYDEHLNLGEGEFDMHYIVSKIPQNSRVVFEVPKVGDSLQNDIKNIKYFKNIYEEI